MFLYIKNLFLPNKNKILGEEKDVRKNKYKEKVIVISYNIYNNNFCIRNGLYLLQQYR